MDQVLRSISYPETNINIERKVLNHFFYFIIASSLTSLKIELNNTVGVYNTYIKFYIQIFGAQIKNKLMLFYVRGEEKLSVIFCAMTGSI